jgi:hypothetical protein
MDRQPNPNIPRSFLLPRSAASLLPPAAPSFAAADAHLSLCPLPQIRPPLLPVADAAGSVGEGKKWGASRCWILFDEAGEEQVGEQQQRPWAAYLESGDVGAGEPLAHHRRLLQFYTQAATDVLMWMWRAVRAVRDAATQANGGIQLTWRFMWRWILPYGAVISDPLLAAAAVLLPLLCCCRCCFLSSSERQFLTTFFSLLWWNLHLWVEQHIKAIITSDEVILLPPFCCLPARSFQFFLLTIRTLE